MARGNFRLFNVPKSWLEIFLKVRSYVVISFYICVLFQWICALTIWRSSYHRIFRYSIEKGSNIWIVNYLNQLFFLNRAPTACQTLIPTVKCIIGVNSCKGSAQISARGTCPSSGFNFRRCTTSLMASCDNHWHYSHSSRSFHAEATPPFRNLAVRWSADGTKKNTVTIITAARSTDTTVKSVYFVRSCTANCKHLIMISNYKFNT